MRSALRVVSSFDIINSARCVGSRDGMTSRHQATLVRIFAHPTPSNIAWRDIIVLLEHLGAEITPGNGSRVRIALNGCRAVFHRPHPDKETDRGAVRSVRDFLDKAGARP